MKITLDMLKSDYSQDPWGWDGNLIPVLGFGYFPDKVNIVLEEMTKLHCSKHKGYISKKNPFFWGKIIFL